MKATEKRARWTACASVPQFLSLPVYRRVIFLLIGRGGYRRLNSILQILDCSRTVYLSVQSLVGDASVVCNCGSNSPRSTWRLLYLCSRLLLRGLWRDWSGLSRSYIIHFMPGLVRRSLRSTSVIIARLPHWWLLQWCSWSYLAPSCSVSIAPSLLACLSALLMSSCSVLYGSPQCLSLISCTVVSAVGSVSPL